MTAGSLLMTAPQFLCDSRRLASAGLDVDDATNATATRTSSSSSSSYWYILLVAQLVYGVGLGPSYSLTISYLDDGARAADMPVYLSVLMTTVVAVPAVVAMLLASFLLTIYVDFYRVRDGDVSTPKDPTGESRSRLHYVFFSLCASSSVNINIQLTFSRTFLRGPT